MAEDIDKTTVHISARKPGFRTYLCGAERRRGTKASGHAANVDCTGCIAAAPEAGYVLAD